MSYQKDPETDQLHLPSDGQWWVKMKRKATFGDEEAAKGSMIKISAAVPNGHQPTKEDVISQTEVAAFSVMLISRLVVEWNLTDQKEAILPITPANVALLDAEDGNFLDDEAMKRIGRRPAAEQPPFKKPSGQRSTGTQ